MAAGYITLGQITACFMVLEVSCNRRDRRIGLNVNRLIAEHGRTGDLWRTAVPAFG
jgi:hypothetical protein